LGPGREPENALVSQLTNQHSIRAEVIVADLSRVGAACTVFEETQQRGLTVDILINDAGSGMYGPFETLDAKGVIINIVSLAAFQPVPYMAVYDASKAFVLSFTEAVWGEYRTKLPITKQQRGGHIVNISSSAARNAPLGSGIYDLTKGGVIVFSERKY